MSDVTVTKWVGDEGVFFEGCLLSESSSREDGKPRWTELALYRTQSGTYLIIGRGATSVAGESVRPWLNVQTAPRDVVRALSRRDRRSGNVYLTDVARDVLEDSGDEALLDALSDFDSASEWLR